MILIIITLINSLINITGKDELPSIGVVAGVVVVLVVVVPVFILINTLSTLAKKYNFNIKNRPT